MKNKEERQDTCDLWIWIIIVETLKPRVRDTFFFLNNYDSEIVLLSTSTCLFDCLLDLITLYFFIHFFRYVCKKKYLRRVCLFNFICGIFLKYKTF